MKTKMTTDAIEEKLCQKYAEIEAEKSRLKEAAKQEYEALLSKGDMDDESEQEHSEVRSVNFRMVSTSDENIEFCCAEDDWSDVNSEESDASDPNFESERDTASGDEEVNKEKMTKSFLQIWTHRTKEIGAQIRMIEKLSEVEMEQRFEESESETSEEFEGFEEP